MSSLRCMSFSPVSSSSMVSPDGTWSPRLLGGANLMWYERPDSLCTQRPQMRSVSTSSGTSSATTKSTLSPASASIASSILVCSTVRGKPSRMNPLAQSASLMRSLMRLTTSSSETRPPLFITPSASLPSAVPAATAERSMSPVESCGIPSVCTILGACEPLPAPGGPSRIMIFLRCLPPEPFGTGTSLFVVFAEACVADFFCAANPSLPVRTFVADDTFSPIIADDTNPKCRKAKYSSCAAKYSSEPRLRSKPAGPASTPKPPSQASKAARSSSLEKSVAAPGA